MDNNDPPPSYNSVIKDPQTPPSLRRRLRGDEKENDNDEKKTEPKGDTDNENDSHNKSGGRMDSTSAGSKEEPKDKRETKSLPTSSKDPSNCAYQPQEVSTTNTTTITADTQPPQRLGIWERFKKGLEDLAMFVIQILD